MIPFHKRIGKLFIRLIPLFFITIIGLSQVLEAQIYDWGIQLGAAASEGVNEMTIDPTGNILISGTYTGAFGGLSHIGGADIFISKLNEQGEVLWTKGGGSTNDDEIKSILTDEEGNIYILGNYLIEAFFENEILTPIAGSKAMFLIKYNGEGSILWTKTLSSSGAKSAAAMALDTNGDLVLTGYFGGNLFVEDEVLEAKADLDLFICKVDSTGNLVWVQQAGEEGDIQAIDLTISDSDHSIAVSGTMIGVLAMEQDTFQSNTNDLDVFVVKFSEDGTPLWGRKAGGVYRDNNTAITSDAADNIYLTGDFRGVIKLTENTQIETDGILDENFYIIKYDKNGTPIWGRSMGSIASEFTQDIIIYNDNKIGVIGYFLGTMEIDGQTATAGTHFDTFIAGFDANDASCEWLSTLKGDNLVLGTQMAKKETSFILAGSFRENIVADGIDLISNGVFDGFVLSAPYTITAIQNVSDGFDLKIYPNPTSGVLSIESDEAIESIVVYNTQGQLLQRQSDCKTMNLESLGQGVYYLKIYTARGKIRTERIILLSS